VAKILNEFCGRIEIIPHSAVHNLVIVVYRRRHYLTFAIRGKMGLRGGAGFLGRRVRRQAALYAS